MTTTALKDAPYVWVQNPTNTGIYFSIQIGLQRTVDKHFWKKLYSSLVQPYIKKTTGGPRLVRFLGLGKNHTIRSDNLESKSWSPQV